MNRELGGIYGFCVGDALGVPAEFHSREALKITPIDTMLQGDNPKLPAGTWSNDSSMMLCLMDSLAEGLDYEDMMVKYYRWFAHGEYTPCGYCFDVGNITREAMYAYVKGSAPLECGASGEQDNGNGSLMRTLPLAFYLKNIPDEAERMDIIHKTSAVTHAHKRSQIACGFYVLLAMELAEGKDMNVAAEMAFWKAFKFYNNQPEYKPELKYFAPYKNFSDFIKREDSAVKSTGYVIDTLEAAVWGFFNTHSYKACVLRAVNLGDDADTIAALAGGLAGIYYGYDAIPAEWINTLQGRDIIERVCKKFFRTVKRMEKKAAQENGEQE